MKPKEKNDLIEMASLPGWDVYEKFIQGAVIECEERIISGEYKTQPFTNERHIEIESLKQTRKYLQKFEFTVECE